MLNSQDGSTAKMQTYKLPAKATIVNVDFNDFYESEAAKKKALRNMRQNPESKLADQSKHSSAENSMNDGDPFGTNVFEFQSGRKSRRSIDIPMEGEISLRDSRGSIERFKSILKSSRRDGKASGADSPLLRLGRVSQSEDLIINGDGNGKTVEKIEDVQEQVIQEELQPVDVVSNDVSKKSIFQLISLKSDARLLRDNSKVVKDAGYKSYWLTCIEKCLEHKDLQKLNKIGYTQTVSSMLEKFSSTEPRTSM